MTQFVYTISDLERDYNQSFLVRAEDKDDADEYFMEKFLPLLPYTSDLSIDDLVDYLSNSDIRVICSELKEL